MSDKLCHYDLTADQVGFLIRCVDTVQFRGSDIAAYVVQLSALLKAGLPEKPAKEAAAK